MDPGVAVDKTTFNLNNEQLHTRAYVPTYRINASMLEVYYAEKMKIYFFIRNFEVKILLSIIKIFDRCKMYETADFLDF